MQQLLSKSGLGASLIQEPACVLGPSLSLLRLPVAMMSEPSLYAAAMERDTRGRVLDMKLLQREAAQVRRYDASQFGLLTAYVYPKGTWERLEVCNDWHVWLFLFDDQVDELAEVGKQPEYLKAYVDACLAVLRGGGLRAEATPLERFTLDLRQRMTRLASDLWMERFIKDVEDYIYRGTLLAARHWTDGTVPDLETYIEQRAMDSAVYTAEDLVEFAEPGQELPEELFHLPLVQRLRQLCTRVVALTNDLFSFEKEVLWHHNPNNFVHLLRVHQGLGLSEAIYAAIDFINADTEAFIACEEALQASRLADPRVLAYVEGLKAWIRGNVHWSMVTGRYSSPTSPFPELRRPASL
jgi:hypothetical protein